MKFKEILSNEELTSSEKVSKIGALVLKARSSYGNSDMVIDEPEINTADGVFKLSMLDDDDKVALAENCYREARILAGEASNQDGVLPDRVVEAFIATNPYLVNLSNKNDSEYL